MAIIKRQTYGDAMREVVQASSRAEALLHESLQRPDVIEGVTSFLDKRAPSFSGLRASTLATNASSGTGKDDHGDLEL
jgi:hypothetical protein